MTCWGCLRHAETGLYGFIEAGCMQCTAREIANGPAAHSRERDPSLIQAEMRRAWPDVADYRKGRALVWEIIKGHL